LFTKRKNRLCEAINNVNNTLRLSGGVDDVERHVNQGTFFILDAQHGYPHAGSDGIWKFAMSLLSHVKKEGR
jgi:hypothetical protein